MDDLSQIQKMRKALGLTQKELAKQANVSQSLIAKIEAGIIDPSYSNTAKIFNALQSMNKKNELKAGEIMTTKIISLLPGESIKKAIKKMKDNNISQMPVIDGKEPVGRITEADILEALTEGASPENAVESIMEDEAPMVSSDTGVELISSLLRHYNFVLVTKKGKPIGVITKTDLLTKAYR